MNKQIDYVVVTAYSVLDLCRTVKHNMLDGYHCIGGVSSQGPEYIQAMVKYETHNPGNRGPG